jgi:hypothetical protein
VGTVVIPITATAEPVGYWIFICTIIFGILWMIDWFCKRYSLKRNQKGDQQ